MDEPLEIEGLHEACVELAHVVLASGQPQVSRDILETLADRFAREAADFALLVAENKQAGVFSAVVTITSEALIIPGALAG